MTGSIEGSMADIRIYDEGLSEEQIQALYEGGGGEVPPFKITGIVYSSADETVTLSWES
jgi:hypothetical protein